MSVLIEVSRIATDDDDHAENIFIEGGSVSLTGRSLDVRADKIIVESEEFVGSLNYGRFARRARFGEGLTGTAFGNGDL